MALAILPRCSRPLSSTSITCFRTVSYDCSALTPEPNATPAPKSCNMGAAADRPLRKSCAYESIFNSVRPLSSLVIHVLENFCVCVHALPKCLLVIHIFTLVKIYSKAATIGPTARPTENGVFPVS